ncbi:Long-chain-fatty-acid--CoA ligase FadD13 [compost metagenome]
MAEVAVVGREDARWGEVPVAYIMPTHAGAVTESEVMAHCREHLAGYKCIKEVWLIGALPRSPIGKVLKRQLQA